MSQTFCTSEKSVTLKSHNEKDGAKQHIVKDKIYSLCTPSVSSDRYIITSITFLGSWSLTFIKTASIKLSFSNCYLQGHTRAKIGIVLNTLFLFFFSNFPYHMNWYYMVKCSRFDLYVTNHSVYLCTPAALFSFLIVHPKIALSSIKFS